jgi:putative nucleotidyltransferase with HDIG domain
VLLESLEGHVPGATEHTDATAAIATAVARALGLQPDRAELVGEAARLHDIGKVYVPAETLAKAESERDDDERLVMAVEAENGAALARGAGIPDDVCEWLLRWSERFDGTGPSGLAGEEIPLEARIINAACACAEAAGNASPPLDGRAAGLIGRALSGLGGERLDPAVAEALTGALADTGAMQTSPAEGLGSG